MAFPATNNSLAKTWQETQQLAAKTKSHAQALVVDLDSDVTSKYLLDAYNSMAQNKLKEAQVALATVRVRHYSATEARA